MLLEYITETKRLQIRYFSENDLNALHNIMSKPEVMYAWEHGFTLPETKQWIDNQINRYQQDGYGYFAVILKETQQLIGQVGLLNTKINGKEVVEIGYIFDSSVWGKGYCIEAANSCIELAFQKFQLQELYCTIRPENSASIKVAERLGMTKVGEYIKFYNHKEMVHYIYVLKN